MKDIKPSYRGLFNDKEIISKYRFVIWSNTRGIISRHKHLNRAKQALFQNQRREAVYHNSHTILLLSCQNGKWTSVTEDAPDFEYHFDILKKNT